MNACLWIICFLFSVPMTSWAQSKQPVFRFHSGVEPSAVDPAALTETSGGFIFSNLYRSLYRLGPKDVPIPELAEKCEWLDTRKTELKCLLRNDIKFSNGQTISAKDFVFAWRRLVDPNLGSRHSEILLPLNNASDIIQRKKTVEELGVRGDGRELFITLKHPDADIFFRLTSPLLTPLMEEPPREPKDFAKAITTGPYRFKNWERKTTIFLEDNPYYFSKSQRPDIEVKIVDDDITALNLYDLGKLDFLRRLNFKEFPKRKIKPGFIFHPIVRLDYVGFGADLDREPEFRKALALALNYPDMSAIFHSPVGCPPIPRTMSKAWPCLKLDVKKAKAAWQKVSPEMRQKTHTLVYSITATEDVANMMEWMQAQWKKHLGAKVEIKKMEAKVMLKEIEKNPNLIFHKGLTLDRPTCLAELEVFRSSSPENYIGLRSPEFDKIVESLSTAPNEKIKKQLCGKGLEILIGQYHLLPMGEIHYLMLARPEFVGWRLTSLNQLDLTDLKSKH